MLAERLRRSKQVGELKHGNGLAPVARIPVVKAGMLRMAAARCWAARLADKSPAPMTQFGQEQPLAIGGFRAAHYRRALTGRRRSTSSSPSRLG